MRPLIVVVLSLVSGCQLFFDDGGKRPPECITTDDVPEAAPAPLRDPENLTCQGFGGQTCNPECGPCPPQTERGVQSDLAPIPSWGVCGSSCESLDEAQCTTDPACRVVLDARCAVAGNCLTDFVGCFPTDTSPTKDSMCTRIASGWECSRDPGCSALHVQDGPCAIDGQCPRAFAMCIFEGTTPGKCHDEALCDSIGPTCPAGTTAGVRNGCWSGVCIPNELCEP